MKNPQKLHYFYFKPRLACRHTHLLPSTPFINSPIHDIKRCYQTFTNFKSLSSQIFRKNKIIQKKNPKLNMFT